MPPTLDHIDKQIVDLLINDGRMSCADIARAIGNISERAVRYRMTKLINDAVIHINAVVMPKALGFSVLGDVFIEVEAGKVFDIAKQIADYENVTYVGCSTGEINISAQVVAHDNVELYNFVNQELGKIPGVRRVTTSILPVILKDVYYWHIPTSIIKED
jgi:Lrp/AsnC family transcriptional regulator for asnA, asnC and gidA